MTREDEEFLKELKDALELEDGDNYLNVLAIIDMMDKKFNKQIPFLDFLEVTSLNDLARLLGRKHFEKKEILNEK